MRTTCLLCVRKHLGQAEALMTEVRQGYPQHAGLAIGHLAEAAAEAMQDHPKLAAEIRVHWKAFELDEAGYEVPTVSLLKTVEELLQAVRKQQEEDELFRVLDADEAPEPSDGPQSFKPEGTQLPETDVEAVARAAQTLAGAGKVDMADITGEVGTGKRGHA